MKNLGRTQAVVWSILWGGLLSLWSASSGAMTLTEAIDQALKNNPGLRSEKVREKIDETRLVEAAGSYLPVVAVGESFISTNNPLNAFGILLNEALVTSSSFSNLNSLNNPANTQTFGFQAQVSETIFSGGGEVPPDPVGLACHEVAAAGGSMEGGGVGFSDLPGLP